jgi:hypothetical protein
MVWLVDEQQGPSSMIMFDWLIDWDFIKISSAFVCNMHGKGGILGQDLQQDDVRRALLVLREWKSACTL